MSRTDYFENITEGATKVFVYKNKISDKGPGAKEGVPFYNPSMELSRDLSIVVGQWLINYNKKQSFFCDGLAASGIRGIRFANEITGDFFVTINDWEPESFNLIKKNIEELNLKNVEGTNLDLNALLSQKKFDYIDIDPFGSPIGFIDSALRSIQNFGIISCTATDTATLCGTYPKVCFRRYGAIPFHSPVMKEIALRILLGVLAREAGKYDKGIKPIISYSTDHYFRIYVQVMKGTSRANDSMSNLSVVKSGEILGLKKTNKDVGPLWLGRLQNRIIIQEMISVLFEKKLRTRNYVWKLLNLLEEEADAPLFFYSTNNLASYFKKSPPKMNLIFEKLKSKGFEITKTHFGDNCFKTNAPVSEIKKIFR